jgi:hypothetical protein
MTLSSEVKVGDKIIITDSEYPINTPNGTIMTVVGFTAYYTVAVADYGDGTPWHMTSNAYKPYIKETTMTQITQVSVGDKIVAINTDYPRAVPNGTVLTVTSDEGGGDVLATVDGSDDPWQWFMGRSTYQPYVKETPMAQMTQEPKLWKDMTPEEKLTLLLARDEGKVIQTIYDLESKNPTWEDNLYPAWSSVCAYRVKPAEPVVETVELCVDGHKITLTYRDGVVDPIAQVEEL